MLSPSQRAREVLAGLLVVLAVLAGAVSLPAQWLAQNVVDREGFLAIAQPLGSDPAFTQQMSDETVDLLMDSSPLPGWANERLEPIAREQAQKLTGTEVFTTIWERTMAEMHAQLFGSAGPIEVSVDLAPAVDSVLGPVNDLLPFGLEVPDPQDTDVLLVSVPRASWLGKAQHLDPWAGRLGIAAIVMAALAVLIAPRRLGMLGAVTAGLMAVGALVGILAGTLERWVPDTVEQAPVLGLVVQRFEALMAQALTQQATTCLIAGGVGLAVVIAVMVVLRQMRCPRQDSNLRHLL